MQRKGISKKLRFDVFKRDAFRCTYCGRQPPDVTLVADHVLPVKEGGETIAANLVTSCFDCNAGKGARVLGDVPPPYQSDAILAQLQQDAERRTLMLGMASSGAKDNNAIQVALDTVYQWWYDLVGTSSGWHSKTVQRFLNGRLSLGDLNEAIHATDRWLQKPAQQRRSIYAYDAWRYFCGCCWQMTRKLADDEANGYLDAREARQRGNK